MTGSTPHLAEQMTLPSHSLWLHQLSRLCMYCQPRLSIPLSFRAFEFSIILCPVTAKESSPVRFYPELCPLNLLLPHYRSSSRPAGRCRSDPSVSTSYFPSSISSVGSGTRFLFAAPKGREHARFQCVADASGSGCSEIPSRVPASGSACMSVLSAFVRTRTLQHNGTYLWYISNMSACMTYISLNTYVAHVHADVIWILYVSVQQYAWMPKWYSNMSKRKPIWFVYSYYTTSTPFDSREMFIMFLKRTLRVMSYTCYHSHVINSTTQHMQHKNAYIMWFSLTEITLPFSYTLEVEWNKYTDSSVGKKLPPPWTRGPLLNMDTARNMDDYLTSIIFIR